MINMCDIYEAILKLIFQKINRAIVNKESTDTQEHYELQLEITDNY